MDSSSIDTSWVDNQQVVVVAVVVVVVVVEVVVVVVVVVLFNYYCKVIYCCDSMTHFPQFVILKVIKKMMSLLSPVEEIRFIRKIITNIITMYVTTIR